MKFGIAIAFVIYNAGETARKLFFGARAAVTAAVKSQKRLPPIETQCDREEPVWLTWSLTSKVFDGNVSAVLAAILLLENAFRSTIRRLEMLL